jgi:branched-chain amino acid transport system ATP-binding protein
MKTRHVKNGRRRGCLMLETRGLTKYFGGLCAVGRINLAVHPGQIVGLIGPNGAGKTTVFNLLTGFVRPTTGNILFEGKDITGLKPHSIARLGMVRTFQLVRILPGFSVTQNMIAASHLYPRIGFREAILNTKKYRRKENEVVARVMDVLEQVKLAEMKDAIAGNLPHGHQKMLGIAMALAAKPKLLLLDESLGGMNPAEVDHALGIMNEIRQRGTAILLIEHNMQAVMTICDRLYVINFGTEICSGIPDEVKRNEEVIAAYLGAGKHA